MAYDGAQLSKTASDRKETELDVIYARLEKCKSRTTSLRGLLSGIEDRLSPQPNDKSQEPSPPKSQGKLASFGYCLSDIEEELRQLENISDRLNILV